MWEQVYLIFGGVFKTSCENKYILLCFDVLKALGDQIQQILPVCVSWTLNTNYAKVPQQ